MQDLQAMRNIGIIAHIDAGKTTTTENMLYFSGLIHRVGNIDDGTTVMDYLDEERARGITIVAAAATFQWRDCLIHLIDTPGHIDFTAEVERSLRVIDGAVVIFSGVEGVEAQSEKVWRQAEHYRVPRLAFINKLDRLGASFDRVLDEINSKFDGLAVALQVPVGIEAYFEAIVDLVSMTVIRFEGDNHEVVARAAIPDGLREEMVARRERLIERLADHSDAIAALFLEGEAIPEAVLKRAIREQTMANRIVPVLTGSAKGRLGVQPLMDAVVDYLPSAADVGRVQATRVKGGDSVEVVADPGDAFAGLVFKIVANTSADLLYVRSYSGTLKPGMKLVNSRTKENVTVKQLLRLFAKSAEPLAQVGPGDIVGVIGPRNCGTGDTLCDSRQLIAFEPMAFPEPVISMAVEPRSSREKDRLGEALALLCREDPTLHLEEDAETGQWLFSGMGELHLEVNLKRLAQEFNVAPKAGEPRVAYRETFKAAREITAKFHRFMGENELEASVTVMVQPLDQGREEMFAVHSAVPGGRSVPKALLKAAEVALGQALRTGGNHGYPLIYVDAALLDLEWDQARTTEGAVVGAVLRAVDLAIREIGTVVMEPLMRLEILSPDETVGDISAYLQPRRALIHSMDNVGTGGKRICCEVPLAEMFGFGKALPKLSGGRASFSMEPCGYQALPADVAKRMFEYL